MSILFVEKKEHFACITLNRPEKMNAMSRELSRRLIQALHDFDNDPDLWVGIVTGAGDRAFCVGADLADPEHQETLTAADWEADYDWHLHSIKKPLIAAVNGYCLGAGFTLALCCDIRIASDKASFGTPDQKLNTVDAYASLMLCEMVPPSIAREILYTGDRISAQEAYRIGLVNRVIPHDRLMSEAEVLAKKICGNGPMAIRACKDLTKRGRALTLEEGLALFKPMAHIVLQMEDTREGVMAFFEKRPPQWKCK